MPRGSAGFSDCLPGMGTSVRVGRDHTCRLRRRDHERGWLLHCRSRQGRVRCCLVQGHPHLMLPGTIHVLQALDIPGMQDTQVEGGGPARWRVMRLSGSGRQPGRAADTYWLCQERCRRLLPAPVQRALQGHKGCESRGAVRLDSGHAAMPAAGPDGIACLVPSPIVQSALENSGRRRHPGKHPAMVQSSLDHFARGFLENPPPTVGS